MTLQLEPAIAEALSVLASAQGLSIEEYLKRLVARELPPFPEDAAQTSGMVEENGLLVYRTGNPLPAQVVDYAIRRAREERAQHLAG